MLKHAFNLLFVAVFFSPAACFAFADLFSQNQCPYSQQPFPTDPQDQQRGQEARVRELKEARSRAEAHMPQMNDELRRLRGNLYYYFKRPWADSMIRHMDNGYDCCQASRVTASVPTTPSFDRKPAGSDVGETTEYETVDPTQTYDQPAPQEEAPQETTSYGSSCGGYPGDYCQPIWGQNESPSTGGRLCLETGFESLPAWYGAACRGGGKIDPSVCGNARISNYPNDYEQCVRILNEYYRVSRDKRYVSSEIQAYNDEIKSSRRSSSSMGDGNGSFLGNFLTTVGPYLLFEYLNYRSQKSMRTQYSPQNLGYFPRGSAGGSIGQPNSLSGRYSSRGTQQPPNFFGNSYGFPFQNGGVLGQLLPALMTGSFGCTGGSGGAGMDILSLLSGGGGAYNPSGGFSSHVMGPYQPNGIYNRPSGFNEQRPFDRRPIYEGSLGTPNSLSGRSRGRTSYLGGTQHDALFYSMMGDARQRISSNQAQWNQQIPLINGDASFGGASGANTYSPFAPGLDTHPLLRSLLMGGNPNASFNLQTFSGY